MSAPTEPTSDPGGDPEPGDVRATEIVSQAAVAELRGELAALRTELATLRAHLAQVVPDAGVVAEPNVVAEASAAPVATEPAVTTEPATPTPAGTAAEPEPVTTEAASAPAPRRRYTAELVLLGLVLIGAVTALAIATRSDGNDEGGGGVAEGEVAVAIAPEAELLSNPPWDDRTRLLRRLPAGTALRLTGRPALELDAGDGLLSTWWPVVVEGSDQAGYVREDLLVGGALPAGTPPALSGPVAVVTDVVSLYDAPARAAQPIAAIEPGARLRITGPIEDRGLSYAWWPVTVEETGQTGYVEAAFLAEPS